MSLVKLKAPPEWRDDTILPFLDELLESKDDGNVIVLDFSQTRWVEPFPTLILAEVIRECVQIRRAAGLRTKYLNPDATQSPQEAITYLGHVGFFQHMGIPYGKAPGEARGSRRYLPLTVLHRKDFEASGDYGSLQESINLHSARLTAIIHKDLSVQDMLTYAFREIIRNVFEHAETDECVIIAQRYLGGKVELGIGDRGRGILRSMSETYTLASPHEALVSAIEPGVSRVRSRGSGKWDNSGFGLYVMSELGRRGGIFKLLSDRACLEANEDGVVVGDANFPGTALRLSISISDAEYFPNVLHQIVEAGEAKVSRTARASGSTTRLR